MQSREETQQQFPTKFLMFEIPPFQQEKELPDQTKI